MLTDAVKGHRFFGRRSFIGGSDARIIMGNDEAALYRVPEIVTRGRFPDGGESDSHGEPRRLVMSAPTPLRQDFDASQLRGLARKTKDGPQARRLLALAAIYNGATRTDVNGDQLAFETHE